MSVVVVCDQGAMCMTPQLFILHFLPVHSDTNHRVLRHSLVKANIKGIHMVELFKYKSWVDRGTLLECVLLSLWIKVTLIPMQKHITIKNAHNSIHGYGCLFELTSWNGNFLLT